jgi:hypothetical protein
MVGNCEQGTLTEGEGSVQLISSFCKKVYNIFNINLADSNLLVQGGQLY